MKGAQTRLTLNPADEATLLRAMATWNWAVRRAWSHAHAAPADPLVPWIQTHTPLTSHLAKSVEARVAQLNTQTAGTRAWLLGTEALKMDYLTTVIQGLDHRLKILDRQFTSIGKKTAAQVARAFRKDANLYALKAERTTLAQKRFNTTRKLAKAKTRLETLEASPNSGAPPVFGGRPLLAQRHRLADPDSPHASESAWRATWDRRRNGEIWALGDGSRSFGNQSAQVDPIAHTLTLRLPEDQALERREAEAVRLGLPLEKAPRSMALKRLTIPNVRFSTTHTEEIRTAQALKLPLTVSIHHQLTPRGRRQAAHKRPNTETGFYLHVAYDLPAPPKITSHTLGVLGIDLNANSLAWAIADPTGNPMRIPGQKGLLKGTIPLKLKGLTSSQAKARVLAAVQTLIGLATQFGVAVSIEALDFSFRKIGAKDKGPAYARMISSLRTAGFADAIQACARKHGIPLHQVDPKWTSVAGFAKYGIRNRFSVDQAAAFQIARIGVLGKHHRLASTPAPSIAKTGPRKGKKLSPKFVRQLQEQRDSFIVTMHESARLPAPLPHVLQTNRKHRCIVGQMGAVTWLQVRKVVGTDRRKWVSRLLGKPAPVDPARRLGAPRKTCTPVFPPSSGSPGRDIAGTSGGSLTTPGWALEPRPAASD